MVYSQALFWWGLVPHRNQLISQSNYFLCYSLFFSIKEAVCLVWFHFPCIVFKSTSRAAAGSWGRFNFQPLNSADEISFLGSTVFLDTPLLCCICFFLFPVSFVTSHAIYIPFSESAEFCFLSTSLTSFLWMCFLLMMAVICIWYAEYLLWVSFFLIY